MDEKQTVLYTWRYVWKDGDGKVFMRHITDVLQGHETLCKKLLQDSAVVSCYREYLGEFDVSQYAKIDQLKVEPAKEKQEV